MLNGFGCHNHPFFLSASCKIDGKGSIAVFYVSNGLLVKEEMISLSYTFAVIAKTGAVAQ
jgi:hypothetical protein